MKRYRHEQERCIILETSIYTVINLFLVAIDTVNQPSGLYYFNEIRNQLTIG